MKLTQISVFLENKEGRLLEICSLLEEHEINIRALNIAETSDYGILRMVVDKPETARSVLKKNDIVATPTDVVGVEVEDRPGGLLEILKILRNHDINVEYMYGFFEKLRDCALLVFRFDDTEIATEILRSHGINIISREALEKSNSD